MLRPNGRFADIAHALSMDRCGRVLGSPGIIGAALKEKAGWGPAISMNRSIPPLDTSFLRFMNR